MEGLELFVFAFCWNNPGEPVAIGGQLLLDLRIQPEIALHSEYLVSGKVELRLCRFCIIGSAVGTYQEIRIPAVIFPQVINKISGIFDASKNQTLILIPPM